MKKLIGLLILLFLITGCTKYVPPITTTTTSTTTTTIPIQRGYYELFIGETVKVDNVLVEIEDISTDGSVNLLLDGQKVIIESTQEPKITHGLEIMTRKITYGDNPEKYHVSIEIKEFKLEEDQYLLTASDILDVDGNKISLFDMHNTKQITIDIDGEKFTLAEGEEKDVGPFLLTNERPFFNDVKAKRWTIIKVTSKVL